jgi:hypothetical protein
MDLRQDDQTPQRWARRRIEDSFRDIYLTLVSIIQGVALGFLAQAIANNYHGMTLDEAGRTFTVPRFNRWSQRFYFGQIVNDR